MIAEIAKKSKKKGGVDPKEYKNCVVFIAEQYHPWQAETIKALRDIGFDSDFKPKQKVADVLKSVDSLKPKFKDVMKFQSFLCEEIEQDQNLNALNLESPFNQKETIEANQAYIFDNFKLDNI